MCTAHTPSPPTGTRPAAPGEDLADRLFRSTIATLELYGVFLGRRLGLYEILCDGRARTSAELASETGLAERYVREWLEQQAVAGVLSVVDSAATAPRRRYALAERHARVVCSVDAADHVGPLADMIVGIAGALPEVLDAYRSGGGVPYAHYGAFFREGQAAINRPAFTHDLCQIWLRGLPDLDARLRARAGARIVDVGCGAGHSTIAVAAAYPNATVVGCDLDAASIEDAREHARRAGSRARFVAGGVEAAMLEGPVDLALVLEVLHDLSDPVGVLKTVRENLRGDGSVLVADERVSERFVAPGDDVERMMYGWSISHCLPTSLAEEPSAALGTVLRSSVVRELATAAGFATCEVLPIENDLFRFYRLS